MMVVIIVLILVGISMAYQSISWWNQKRQSQDEAGLQATYIAESGANQYLSYLNSPASLNQNPMSWTKTFLHGGYYWIPDQNVVMVGSTNSGQAGSPGSTGWYSVQVAAKFNGVTRRVDMLISRSSAGAFNKVFDAENQKGGAYQADFATGDIIRGDAYIGGDVNATGTAQLLDNNGSKGNVTKYTGNNYSNLTGGNPPTFVNGKEDPLDLSPDASGKTRWEKSAIEGRTNNNIASNGGKYIDVANELTTKGTSHKWVDGSTGTDITDVNNPAHIFRKDPGSTNGQPDRTSIYEHTSAKSPKSSYYLEDPTNSAVTTTSLNGTAHPVNGDTTASMINVKDSGNNAVYFIDGNMRVSGEPVKSYQLAPDPSSVQGPLKMTIVVKGNVSLTDNVLLPSWQSKTDGLAIVAIEDPAYPNVDAAAFAAGSGSTKLTANGVSIDTFVTNYNKTAQDAINAGLNFQTLNLSNAADWERAAQEYNKIYGSGNVYFGDPGSGTVEHFESFLYAQNNFYATNLDSTKGSGGTQRLEIYGNMAAGNKVMINRSTKTAGYIPLNLTFNPLISSGGSLPDLPLPKASSSQPWTIQSWKQATDSAETGGDVK